jgi:hypothetical protein
MPASPGNYLSSAEGAQPLPRPWLRPRAPAALHRLLPYLALLPLLALLIVGANMALLTLWGQQPYRVDAGTYGDQLLLRNFYAQEANAAGETYRWSSNDSTIVVSGAALTPAVRARLLIGGTPADAGQSLPTELTVNGRNWGTFAVASTPRRYELLLPSDTGASLRLGLSSPLTRAPGEERALGVRLDAVELQLGAGPLLPLPLHLLAQLACLLLLIPICGALRLPRRATIGLLIAAALLLALLQAAALPLMGMYLPRLVGVCAALALLTTTALPFARRQLSWVAERDLRWLWGVMLLACLLRMLPMLYPPFATHDLPLNLKRLDAVTRGVLVLIAPSAEFAGEMTIYPPAPYVALLPTYLLLDSRPLVLQFGLALLDGTGALFVGLLALRLHAGSLAGRMAALLYAGSSIGFTVLWWGFTAQAFGQWFTAPLALLLIAAAKAGQVRTWLLAGLAFLVALLTHAGVAVLAVVWVTLVLGLLLIWARLPWRWWRGALLFYVGTGVLAFVLLYADVFLFMIGETRDAGATAVNDLFGGVTQLFLKGLLLAYTPVGLAFVVVGLWRLWGRLTEWGQRAVVLGWVGTVLVFVVVDLLFGLIVRHFYFLLPLACVAGAFLLAELSRRNLWLRGLAWALVALYALNGLLLWWLATVEYIKPTMAPLTH